MPLAGAVCDAGGGCYVWPEAGEVGFGNGRAGEGDGIELGLRGGDASLFLELDVVEAAEGVQGGGEDDEYDAKDGHRSNDFGHDPAFFVFNHHRVFSHDGYIPARWLSIVTIGIKIA